MATDAGQIIAGISDKTDPTRTVQGAVQMRDMVDQEQLRQLQLGAAKKAASDQEKYNQIMSGQDISTPEGAHKAVQELNRAGLSSYGMDLLRTTNQAQAAGMDLKLKQGQLQQLTEQQHMDAIDKAGTGAYAVYQTLTGPGDPAQNLAAAKRQLQQLTQQYLQDMPANAPWAAQVRQQLAAANAINDPKQLRQALMMEMYQSRQARDAYDKQQASQADIDLKQSETGRNNAQIKAIQNGKLVAVQMPDGSTAYMPSSQAIGKAPGSTGGRYGISEPTTQAGQSLKDAFISATGGKVTLGQLRGMNFDRLAASGQTAQQLLQSGLTYQGNERAASTVGQRTGNVAVLEGSFGGAADQVRSALAKVDRGSVQSVNAAIAKGKMQFGDPDEARYAAAIQTAVNEYARVVGGGTGASTDSARAEASSLLSRAQSPAQVMATLAQMQREVSLVQAASHRALSSVGATGAPAAAGGPAGQQPPPGFVLDR